MGEMADYHRDDSRDWEVETRMEYFNEEYYEYIFMKYLKGKLYWKTKDGKRILIQGMEDDHIINTRNYLLKRINAKDNYAIDEWIDVFNSEIEKRNLTV